MSGCCAVGMVFLLAGPVFGQAEDDAAARIEALKRENEALREQVEQLQQENARLREQLAPADQPAAAAPSQQRIDELEQQLAVEREKSEDLEVEKEQLEKLAGMTAKGELIESDIAQASVQYIESRDRTVVRSEPRPILLAKKAGFTEHYLGASYTFSGQQMTAPPDTLTIELFTSNNPTTRYGAFKNATLMIDGEPTDIAVTDYEVINSSKSPARGGRTGGARTETRDELITFDIDQDLLRRLARANLLVIELPNLTLPLGRDHIAMFEMMRTRMNMSDQSVAE